MADYEVFNADQKDPETPKKKKSFGIKSIVLILIIVFVGILLLTGVYQVGPSEVALVRTFGQYSYTQGSGIAFHLPYPIQSHEIIDIRSIQKIEIGFRTTSTGSSRDVVDESNMITGDENILSLEAVVQYRIIDPVKYAFNILNAKDLVKLSTESVLRERVSLSTIDDVLTSKRDVIGIETSKIVQENLDKYESGIKIENVYLQDVTPPKDVVASFDDVNNAKQDKEKMINDAQKYSNDVIPKAKGNAEKVLREAEGYAYEKIALAEGDAEQFRAVLKEYNLSKDITKKRIILDAIKDMIESAKIKVVSDSGNTLKLLNLDEMFGGDSK
ncbi:MAG TPA: FtsH protease activity modulator HflK [Tepiditoga sp.]|nr:FtsH protease activity modulator HflK [Tepiditoga sp.]